MIMARAKPVEEEVEKTVRVMERTGVDWYLTQEEVDFLVTVLGRLPGEASHTETGRIAQRLHDSLSQYTSSPTYWRGPFRVVSKGEFKVERVNG